MKRLLTRLGFAVAVGLAFPVLTGCMMGRTVTPADLDRNGTKVYAGHGRAEVVKASALALRTLGYNVVLEDMSQGRVKTAPKVVQVMAVGNATVARAYENEIAWSLEVSGSGDGTVVKAVPRASTNGQPVDMSRVSADYMDQVFSTLWSEIDSNLGKQTASSPSKESTPPPTAEKKKSQATAI